MAEVSLERITCTFRHRRSEVRAVDDLTLRVSDGELMVLLGPSGCGKTTILRAIAGLTRPDAGVIRFDGADVNGLAPKDRDVAMVFQNDALYPHMTVHRNMAFGLRMRGVPRAQVHASVDQAARTLGISHLLSRRPAALSGGEKQRVALGRAIVRRPKVFLLDEPLSHLDATLRMQMRTELKTLHRELRTTAIHVTHDQEEAMSLGDRIAVIRSGVLQQCASPVELYQRPANRFVAGFVGTPPMNFVTGRVHRDGVGWAWVGPLGRMALPVDGAGAPVVDDQEEIVLGVRPQHVRVGGSAGGDGLGAHSMTRVPDVCTVRSVEPLGEVTNVYLTSPTGVDLTARTPPSAGLCVGDRVSATLDLTHAHWFAADTGGRRLNGETACPEKP